MFILSLPNFKWLKLNSAKAGSKPACVMSFGTENRRFMVHAAQENNSQSGCWCVQGKDEPFTYFADRNFSFDYYEFDGCNFTQLKAKNK